MDIRRMPGSLPGFVRYETYERGEMIHFAELRAGRDDASLPQWVIAYFREHPDTPSLRLI